MPAPPEDDGKTTENLPDPELNPMTNTLLAQNMGRWAEVYFTTPPEKRDEAVQELLRELRSGVKSAQNGAPEEKIALSEQEILDAKQKFVELEVKLAELQGKPDESAAPESGGPADRDLICPACLSKNKGGQRFCGSCGFNLSADDRASTTRAGEPVTQAKSGPPAIERATDDWGWLHERHRTALAEQKQEATSWKYVALVIVILIGCGFGYLWWRGSLQTSSADEKGRNQAVREERNTSGTLSPNVDKQATAERAPTSDDASSAPAKAPFNSNPAVANPPTKAATQNEATDAVSEHPDSAAEGGTQELETARRYLDGRGVAKDSSLAAQWLWKSVGKKNTEALVRLSEMYAAGDGVPKSCDQARLLLSAAAQKGSQEARDKLRTVITNCQ